MLLTFIETNKQMFQDDVGFCRFKHSKDMYWLDIYGWQVGRSGWPNFETMSKHKQIISIYDLHKVDW